MDYLTFVILCCVICPFYILVFSMWFWFRAKYSLYEGMILKKIMKNSKGAEYGDPKCEPKNKPVLEQGSPGNIIVGAILEWASDYLDTDIAQEIYNIVEYFPGLLANHLRREMSAE